jgi:Fic family protein
MEASEFTPAMPGRLVTVAGGPADARVAFVPQPLPPNRAWPARLWPLLLEARIALASLNGTGRHLPNPEILLKPLQLREAQLSSQLEGTVTDPHQQALFQADPSYPTSEHDPNNAFREVFNYALALRLSLHGADEGTLSLHLIRELHGILMDGVRGAEQSPGRFRTTQNQIGKPARFVPPPPEHLTEVLEHFEAYLKGRTPDASDPLVRSFLAHYQFETIHPFGDGNGRVGRLLLALTIAEWCGLADQWLYMSAYFERQKTAYMDLLKGVSTHGAWDAWIEFCLQGVVEQAHDTERRCEKLLALHRDFHVRLKGGSVRLANLVDALFENPVVTVTGMKRRFFVTHPTARADLRRLEGLRIIEPLAGMNQITYFCPGIYQITYEGVG